MNAQQFKTVGDIFVSALGEYTGLPPADLQTVGAMGAYLFDAEFKIMGTSAYRTSVVQLIRNVYYQVNVFQGRWADILHKLEFTEPLLDYGCGCGFMGAMLGEIHGIDVYGVELPGPQSKFLKIYGDRLGIKFTDPTRWSHANDDGKPFGTVICSNMLEHVRHPMPLLRKLYEYSDTVYANCDTSEALAHIAPMKERHEVNALLEKAGGLLI